MTVTTEPSSRSLSANGLSLHYLEWGRPGALPVVCVHGYTSSAQAFNALARHLQDRFHVLAPRCPRAWGERLVAGRSLRLRRSGRRRGGVREPSVAATHRSDRAESGITRHRSAARKGDSSGATPAILLNARRTQTSQAVSLESVFPGE
jgi:hypothetical protein